MRSRPHVSRRLAARAAARCPAPAAFKVVNVPASTIATTWRACAHAHAADTSASASAASLTGILFLGDPWDLFRQQNGQANSLMTSEKLCPLLFISDTFIIKYHTPIMWFAMTCETGQTRQRTTMRQRMRSGLGTVSWSRACTMEGALAHCLRGSPIRRLLEVSTLTGTGDRRGPIISESQCPRCVRRGGNGAFL